MTPPPPCLLLAGDDKTLQRLRDFEVFDAQFDLLAELFFVFNWFEGTLLEEYQKTIQRALKGVSIFTGTMPTAEALAPRRKKKKVYKTRADFGTDDKYGNYVKNTLRQGMRVKARGSYESVSEGDYGVYRQTNNGHPPAQFAWDGLGGDTYWLWWHQVEILPPISFDNEDDDPATIAYQRPLKQPYVMRSLDWPTDVSLSQVPVSQPFWWEVLCLANTDPELVETVVSIIRLPHIKTLADLVSYTPTHAQCAQILEAMERSAPFLAREPLSVKELSQFREKYSDPTQEIAVANDNPDEQDKALAGPYRLVAPYLDPYDQEDPIHSYLPHDIPNFEDMLQGSRKEIEQLFRTEFEGKFPQSRRMLETLAKEGLEDAPQNFLRTVSGYLKYRREDQDPVMQLRSLEHRQDGTMALITQVREALEKHVAEHPTSARVATHGLRAYRSGVQAINVDSERQAACTSGLFNQFLRLVKMSPTSCKLQCVGVDCFFHLMGGFSIFASVPHPQSGRKTVGGVSEATKAIVIGTLESLVTSDGEEGGLRVIVSALATIVDCYNMEMGPIEKKNCVYAVRHGLFILAGLLKDCELQQKMVGWGIPDLLYNVKTKFPEFSTKKDVCALIVEFSPECGHMKDMLDRDDFGSEEARKALVKEMLSVIKALRRSEDIYSRNPLPRLLRIMDRDMTSNDMFLRPGVTFARAFLKNKGVFYLTQAMDANKSATFTENALTILGSLIKVDEETAAHVVMQGGLRAVSTCMHTFPGNKPIQRLCLNVLEALSKDSDHVTVMYHVNLLPALKNVREKYPDDFDLTDVAFAMNELIEANKLTEAERNQKIIRIIFAGMMEMMLNSVEDSRRAWSPLFVPKFSAFVKYLSAGSGGGLSMALRDNCWEKTEVSSNSHRSSRILDNDSSTYWESTGRNGSHWLRLYMKRGLIIKKLCMDVNPSDSSYMPQRITVQGGVAADHVEDLSTVYIPSTFLGEFELLKNCKKHYPVIVLRIKRSQQGGIDVRVRRITCETTRTSLWSLFGDLFSVRTKLFYNIQVQTWLNDPSLTSLDVFDRMNAVVLHEQLFADHFLMTPAARYSLGQSLRVALITPLIDKFTVTQVEGGEKGSSLPTLMNDYVSQMQPPVATQWQALVASTTVEQLEADTSAFASQSFDFVGGQKRLIQMSRIRRMCRLLVDCDMNTPTRRAMELGIEPNTADLRTLIGLVGGGEKGVVQSGDSITAIAFCWRDLVKARVTGVVNRFDQYDSPQALAADLVSVYDQLKQAMLELFGGHSTFALSLKEGFSNAFRSLNEMQGLRFCEILCRCIDSLMNTACRDAARFQSVGEHQREAMLMHFAEPLQFIHNLDIAHVFEHYYRAPPCGQTPPRTLRLHDAGEASSADLLSLLPPQVPLQMLQDLEESGSLMDRFCDSELLESLDQMIIQTASSNMSQKVMDLAMRSSFYRQRRLQVSILNACFWPLRHHPMPSPSSLPKPLDSFCDEYQKFFNAAHENAVKQHERARKLHWTLHGWASVQYSGLNLSVTTVQMIVLLFFNSAETLTMKTLHDSTLIDYSDLSDALLGLTAKRQSVLLHTHNLGSAPPPSELPPGDNVATADAPLPNTHFRPSSVFTINEAFPMEVGRSQESNIVLFHEVKKINRKKGPSHTRAERILDLTHILERRRTIMDAGIIRIMKKEKEIAVNSLAIKIIKACGTGRFSDRQIEFGKFEVEVRDVCSRVERLIGDGYLKRTKNNPQTVAYVPDPDSQPETAAKEGEGEGEEEREKEETMEQEIGEGEEEEKSVRKRPTSGGGSPAVKKNKRRKEEGAQLLKALLSSPSMTVDKVEEKMVGELDSLTQILHVERPLLEALLVHSKWNHNQLLRQYLENSTTVMKEAGLGDGDGAEPPPADSQVTCPACLKQKNVAESMWLSCNHVCCKTCWERHLRTELEAGHALSSACLVENCPARTTRAFFAAVLGEDSEEFKKYNSAVIDSYIESNPQLTWCRNPAQCDQILSRGEGVNSGTCRKCKWCSCFLCKYKEGHPPASCEDIEKWIKEGGYHDGMDQQAKTKHLKTLTVKKCPACQAQVEKHDGSLCQTCKCGMKFCWKCVRPWKPLHSDYSNCSFKFGANARQHRKLNDYNERVTNSYKSRDFAMRLCDIMTSIGEAVPMKTLSFVNDGCELLVQCHKMMIWATIAEYYTPQDGTAYLTFLVDDLDANTTALQTFLENVLLRGEDMATSLRSIRERRLLRNYRLVSKIENTMNKFLIGFQHVGPHSPILSYPMSPYPMSCTVILHVSVLSYPHAPILYVSVLSCP
ncbi:Cullin-9, partial [Geodia barretti]